MAGQHICPASVCWCASPFASRVHLFTAIPTCTGKTSQLQWLGSFVSHKWVRLAKLPSSFQPGSKTSTVKGAGNTSPWRTFLRQTVRADSARPSAYDHGSNLNNGERARFNQAAVQWRIYM